MFLSFKPEKIIGDNISDEALFEALEEAYDLRLRRYDEPKTAFIQKLMFDIIPMKEIENLGLENLPFFLDCYSAWMILEYLKRKDKIALDPIDLQKMFSFEYLDSVVRRYENEYVSFIQSISTTRASS